jgi:hypothetical protein
MVVIAEQFETINRKKQFFDIVDNCNAAPAFPGPGAVIMFPSFAA